MALASSGALSFSQIQTEFGGSNPISLSEYYKGGGLVHPSTTDPNTIPGSGLISVHDFHGSDQYSYQATWHYDTIATSGNTYAVIYDSDPGYDDYVVGLTASPGVWDGYVDGAGVIRCDAGTTTVRAVAVRTTNPSGLMSSLSGWQSHASKAGSNNEQLAGAGAITSAQWGNSQIVGWGVNGRTVYMNGSTTGLSLTVKSYY